MTRFKLMLMVGMAIVVPGLAGCAICDTCDDFPSPCIGPNCGGSQVANVAPGLVPMPPAPPMTDSAGQPQ